MSYVNGIRKGPMNNLPIIITGDFNTFVNELVDKIESTGSCKFIERSQENYTHINTKGVGVEYDGIIHLCK